MHVQYVVMYNLNAYAWHPDHEQHLHVNQINAGRSIVYLLKQTQLQCIHIYHNRTQCTGATYVYVCTLCLSFIYVEAAKCTQLSLMNMHL